MSLSRAIDIQPNLTGALEYPCYGCERNSVIESILFAFGADEGLEAVNFTTIEIINKGNDGTGTTVIATITTDSGDPDGEAITKWTTIRKEINVELTKDDVLTIKKTDNGTAVDLGYSSIVINERRK